MNKENCLNVLKENGYDITIENAVIFVNLDEYTEEEIKKASSLVKEYKGSIGFRPKKEETNEE